MGFNVGVWVNEHPLWLEDVVWHCYVLRFLEGQPTLPSYGADFLVWESAMPLDTNFHGGFGMLTSWWTLTLLAEYRLESSFFQHSAALFTQLFTHLENMHLYTTIAELCNCIASIFGELKIRWVGEIMWYNWYLRCFMVSAVVKMTSIPPGTHDGKTTTLRELGKPLQRRQPKSIWCFQAMYNAVHLVRLNKVIIGNLLDVPCTT